MLSFEEELKKFDKSLEPSEIDDALASMDITDMNDVMFKLMQDTLNVKNKNGRI